MTEDRYYRRASDKKLEKINEMIEQEQDPKTRGLLMILHCIGDEVVGTRNEVQTHSEILKEHQEVVARITSSWKVIAWIVTVLQVPLLGLGSYMFDKIRSFDERMLQIEVMVHDHVAHCLAYQRDRK